MNRILKTARIVKGLSTTGLAALLGISNNEYIELECQVSRMTAELAQSLALYFSLPVYYFVGKEPLDVKERIEILKRQAIISSRDSHLKHHEFADPASLLHDLITAKEELQASIAEQLALTEMLMAVLQLYDQQCNTRKISHK